jgi:hypothetical protein
MATNVNVTIGNWRTGTNVTIARRLVDVSISYLDANNTPQTKAGTITFPDVLALLSADDLREMAMEIMLKAYMRTQGIDS